MNSTPTRSNPPAPGVSGKRVTLIVLLGLFLVGGFLSYTLWTYNRFDDARKSTTLAWRELTEQLAMRYRVAEKIIAKRVDSRETKMEFGERFQLAVERFRTTARTADQFVAAQSLEELLRSDDFRSPLESGNEETKLTQPGELLAAIDAFNLCRDRERMLLESPGGKTLDVFLKFDTTDHFQLAN